MFLSRQLAVPACGTRLRRRCRALFTEIYGYRITLPKDSPPRLYLHGLSIGAMNSEQSTDLVEVLGDPFAGALWSGLCK
jgi:uncharacterized membrane protein